MRALVAMGLLLACVSTTLADDEPETKTAATNETTAAKSKKSVQFDGETLILAFEQNGDEQSLQEFILEGQNLDKWTKLAAIRQYEKLDDPKALVQAMAKRLKETNADAPFSIMEQEDDDAVIIDFVTWPEDGSFVEFNIFKYRKRPEGGLIAEQYALRAYENSEEFLSLLRPLRERLVDVMATTGLEVSDDEDDNP